MRFPAGLRALNHAEFRRFYAAQWLSLVGGWIQTVAQSWLVLQLTGSPLRLGLIATLQFAPVLLFSVVAGAVADRLSKRRVLIATQVTLALQAATLAALVWTDSVAYWHVCALGLLLGFASVVDQPARQSFVLELVGREDVGNAVALNSAGFNAARIVGPALAGLLIARVGVAPAFAANALSFVAVIVALATLRDARPAPRSGATMWEEILEGLRYTARTPAVVLVLALVTVVSLFVFNFTVYVPLLARTVLGLGAEGFGFLMAALGVGAVAGALIVGATTRELPLELMILTAALAVAGLVGLSAVRQFWTAAPLLFTTGFFGIMLMAGCNTRLQLQAPPALRGRLMSLYVLLTGGVFPIGAFLVGAMSERWGVSTAFFVNGCAGLASLALIALWWRRRR